MVEISLKNNPIRLIWYSTEDTPAVIFETQRWRYMNRPRVWRPPTDVYENDEAFVVRVEVGGMRESDFAVYLDGRHLLISGTRTDTPEKRAFHQMEIPFGEFIVEVELPQSVVSDGVEAYYKDGFLKIILPKALPHHIRIKE